MKNKIKIKFIDFWDGFDPEKEEFIIFKLLCKHFDVEISDDPDYVIFSAMGDKHWDVPDSCIKIFYTGECVTPDFNSCDYAIGFDYLSYGDRYIRFPYYLAKKMEMVEMMEHKHELLNIRKIKDEKTEFCSFIVSNPLCKERNDAFFKLSEYKKVNSGGHVYNNIGHIIKDKYSFEKKHKFSLCFENTRFPGYTTEKIIEAFAARTIPIYWGDPILTRIFNEKAFINVASYSSFDEVIDKVKSIDEDDELYFKMLSEPALLSDSLNHLDEVKRMELWLLNIFKQTLDNAKRRDRGWYAKYYVQCRKKSIKKRTKKDLLLSYLVFIHEIIKKFQIKL